jgi:hypothetical protein
MAVPDEHVGAPVLNAALEATTRLNEKMLADGQVPPFEEGLRQGVRWKPEPPGAERFDHARTVLNRKWGDCDDLAPWHAASLRDSGEDPDAEAIAYRSGPNRWHAVVRRSNGNIEDPSAEAGMRRRGGREVEGVAPAVVPVMFRGSQQVVGEDGELVHRPSIAVRPLIVGGRICGYEGRSDLPFHDSEYALSAMHRRPVASQALCGAILGSLLVGEASGVADYHTMSRMTALCGILNGRHPLDLAEELGEEVVIGILPVLRGIAPSVGFNFGGLLKSIAPFASKLISFIPGVGPLASTAIDVVSQLAKTPGGQVAADALHQLAPAAFPHGPLPPSPMVVEMHKGAYGGVPGGQLVKF